MYSPQVHPNQLPLFMKETQTKTKRLNYQKLRVIAYYKYAIELWRTSLIRTIPLINKNTVKSVIY